MFSALILVCTLDYSKCEPQINRVVFETKEQCYSAIAQGIDFFESSGFVVAAYDCYSWDSSALDEQL